MDSQSLDVSVCDDGLDYLSGGEPQEGTENDQVRNIWIFTNDALLGWALEWKEWVVLAVSVLILFVVSIKQEQGVSFSKLVFRQPVYVRWILYLIAIFGIMSFGVYGAGYDAQAFIYGGF